MDSDHVSILLDIKSEVGALNARMLDAARSRERMENNINELKGTVSEIAPVVAVVAEIRPQVKELMDFKVRIGAYIVAAGVLWSAAVWLLWQGIAFFSDIIKAKLGFH